MQHDRDRMPLPITYARWIGGSLPPRSAMAADRDVGIDQNRVRPPADPGTAVAKPMHSRDLPRTADLRRLAVDPVACGHDRIEYRLPVEPVLELLLGMAGKVGSDQVETLVV